MCGRVCRRDIVAKTRRAMCVMSLTRIRGDIAANSHRVLCVKALISETGLLLHET